MPELKVYMLPRLKGLPVPVKVLFTSFLLTIGIAYKVTPSKHMVDLILEDAKTGKPITEADINAKIQLPDDSHVEKKLTGMKMGDIFSFMSALDMSRKGTYHFEIFVRAANKDIKFNFEHHLK